MKAYVFARNANKHDDVSYEQKDNLVGQALYREDNNVVHGKHPSGDYYIFYVKTQLKSKNGKLPLYSTVALDIVENPDYFEIVHWHVVRERSMRSVDPNFKV